ncbi:MAG: tandem-95 repeat protein [Bacteroidetes bacterium]|nr:tandem-95 repeat protein [Bacteroidota bacterium]
MLRMISFLRLGLLLIFFALIGENNAVKAQVIAFDDFVTVPEDSSIIISPFANDIITGAFSIQKNGNFPGNNNVQTINNFTQFLYTPDPSFSGFDTIGYRICTTNIPPFCDTAIIVVQVLPRPDPPVARPDTIYMNEDTDTLISVLKNDYDLDGDSLFILVPVGPKHAQTATNVGFQKIYYKPVANYYGLDSMFYTACDDQDFGTQGLCSPLTLVYIVIKQVNDPPIANNDRDTLFEDQSKCISVLLNDTDIDFPNERLIVTGIAQDATNGNVSFTNSQVCYIPNPNFFGRDTVKYIVCDTTKPVLCDTASIFLVINPVNDKPIAGDDNYIINEDKDSCFSVLINDSDVEGIVTLTSINDAPNNGSANIVGNTICYFPNDNFNGRDTLFYVITDNAGLKDTARVIIQLLPVEDAPIAIDDNIITNEDTQGCVNVLANDIEVDGDVIVISATFGGPKNGTISINGGQICYLPNNNFNGRDTIKVIVCDNKANGKCDTSNLFILVNPINDKPVANDDNLNTIEDVQACINILGNDVDVDGNPLVVTSSTNPKNGTINIVNGVLCYTPNPNFNGKDTVTYIICENLPSGLCDTAKVFINVSPVEDAPIANNDNATTNEDVPICVNVLSNDSDVDGDPLVISGTFGGPRNGTVSIVGNQVCYNPSLNFNGKDTLKVIVCDNKGNCDTSTLIITVNPVNDKPVANDDAIITPEDVRGCVNVLLNDFDVDGDPIIVTNSSGPKNGTITFINGVLCYTPNDNFQGKDTVTYILCENKANALCDTAIVVINVNSQNDKPIANNDNITTNEDTQGCVNILSNDSDPDGDPIIVTNTSGPSKGTFTLNNGLLCYTPNPNFNGRDTITYIICENTANGLCDTAQVFILVNPVEDAPIANDDNATTNEDTPICVNVLANDTEPDGDAIVLSGTTGGPKNGTVSIQGNQVCYSPNLNFNGKDTIRVIVCDNKGKCDTSLLVITVVPVNDPPKANDDIVSTNEDTQVCVNVLANDSDPENDPLVISNTNGPKNGTVLINGGVFCYTPNPNYNGKDTIIYIVCENRTGGLCDTALVLITINSIQDAPISNNDNVTTNEDTPICVNVLANDTDPDGDVLVVSGTAGGPRNGTVLINNNQVCYTPAPNFNGIDTIKVVVCDNTGKCDTSLLIINVLPINDPPIANDNIVSTNEDTQICVNVLANDSDVDGPNLGISSIFGVSHGTIFIQGNQVCYTPFLNYNGKDTVFYVICDNGNPNLCDTARVLITVIPVNDKPIAVDDIANGTIGQPVVFNILTNDSDPEGDPLTISILDQPNNGSISVQPSGQVTYTPNVGFVGIDTFVYSICDPGGLCDTATVIVQFLDLTDVIIARDECVTLAEDQTITINVLANDLVDPNKTITMTLSCLPKNGQATIVNNQVFYQPGPNFNGLDSLCYRICFNEQNPKCAEGKVCITVTPTPDAPIANPDYTTTDTITPVNIDVQANDIDVDGQGIVTSSITDNPNNGIATIINGDEILYTPNSGFVGFDTLIYQLCKFGFPNLCDTALVVIVVGNPNNPPVANIDTIITVVDRPETVNVLINDFDPDGDNITVTSFTNPKNGTVVNQGNGVFEYTPKSGFFGVDSFTYIICDDGFITLCDTGIVRIEVLRVKVPNSISPNGDGNNDGVVIPGLEFYPDNYLKIFNRWGDIVFEANQYQNNWKGQLENAGVVIGERVPTGTYFYLLYLGEGLPVLKGFIMVEY